MINNIISAAVIVILIACVGFFTSSETAYLSLPKVKLRSMVEEGKKHAKLIARLKDDMSKLLTTVLIGTNFLNSLCASIATALALRILGQKGTAIAPFITAFFITTFAQIIPKTFAAFNPEKVTQFSSVPLFILEKIFFPIIWLFSHLSNLAVSLFTKIFKPTSSGITHEELETLIDVGKTEGTIEKDESELLNKIIKFNNLSVSEIMKHHSSVSMISSKADYQTVLQEFLRSGFSTITVYKNSKENVVGVLNYKKIIFGSTNIDRSEGFAGRMMNDVLFVPGTFSVLELLKKFKSDEHKFAVVLDEMGQTAGIVTMEDIMKVVFNRMTDENSYDDRPPEDKIKLISTDSFIVPGNLRIEDVNEILGLKLESQNMTTIAGWLLEQFGFLPTSGMIFIKDKILFTAEEVRDRKIVTVRIKTK